MPLYCPAGAARSISASDADSEDAVADRAERGATALAAERPERLELWEQAGSVAAELERLSKLTGRPHTTNSSKNLSPRSRNGRSILPLRLASPA